MLAPHHALGRARHHAAAIFAVRAGPLPQSAMLRSGCAVCASFLLFLALGHPQAATIGAIFTNFLCLSDRAPRLPTRLWSQIIGALLFMGLGALGAVLSGHPTAILAIVFVVALGAGFVHGTIPGLEAVPRFALCCFVVTAFIPFDHAEALAAALVAASIALATVIIDDWIRSGRRGRHVQLMRAGTTYPGPRFSLVYACAAWVSLAAGLVFGQIRPYWVTVTTLLVMQSDRRANAVRVEQRFVGTLAGVVMAFAVVSVLPPAVRPQGLLALVLALPFLWPLGYDRNYALGVAILCAWVLLLIDTQLPSADLAAPLFLARLSDTAIGCAIALAGSLAVAEVREDTST